MDEEERLAVTAPHEWQADAEDDEGKGPNEGHADPRYAGVLEEPERHRDDGRNEPRNRERRQGRLALELIDVREKPKHRDRERDDAEHREERDDNFARPKRHAIDEP